MKKLFNVLLFAVTFSIMSCQDVDQVSPDAKMSGKWMAFESREDLADFIKKGKDMELDAFKSNVRHFEDEGFKPLLPLLRETDVERTEVFKARKLSEWKRFRQVYNRGAQARAPEDYEIDLEYDEIIGDPYFASLLNEEREILVEGYVYKFTEKGLFFTKAENYKALDKQIQLVEPCMMLQTQGTVSVGNNVQAFLPAPIDDGCGGGGGGGGCPCGGGGGSGGGAPDPTREEIRDNLKVCEYREGVLNTLFGPSEKCIDKFSDKKRIKVRTWAQNYLVFASTGIRVKSQKRVLGVWWPEKIDELELGYAMAYFKYTGIGSWPSISTDFQYEMNGYTVDQYGRYISGGSTIKQLFTDFPLSNKRDIATIYLGKPLGAILGEDDDALDITGKDVNKRIQQIVDEGYDQLERALKKTFSSNEAVIVSPDKSWKELKFWYCNWKKVETDENKISEIFDWNTAVIGVKINGNNTTHNYSPPKKPKDFQIVGYGMGRRGSDWRGGRVVITN